MKAAHLCFIAIIIICTLSTSADAGWNFGLGTGPTMLSVDGNLGINTALFGPVEVDMALDPHDIYDLTDSAFGLGGYAATGKWLFQASFGKLGLEGAAANANTWAQINFDITTGEFTTSYTTYENSYLKLNLLGGFRYTKHELSSDIRRGGIQVVRDIDNDWIDAVVGASIDVPFSDTLSWNTRLDAGFGGSEGTYTANTGLTWRFYKGWSGTLFYKYAAVEFENGSRGSSDWYLYDVDEQYLGLTILYNW